MKKRNIVEEVRAGLEEYASNPDVLTRRVFPEPDPAAIRRSLSLSQREMAVLMNVSLRTWQNWEQRHRALTGPVRAFLRVLETEPEAVFRAMRS